MTFHSGGEEVELVGRVVVVGGTDQWRSLGQQLLECGELEANPL